MGQSSTRRHLLQNISMIFCHDADFLNSIRARKQKFDDLEFPMIKSWEYKALAEQNVFKSGHIQESSENCWALHFLESSQKILAVILKWK